MAFFSCVLTGALLGVLYIFPHPAAEAAREGYGAYVLFVIQMEDVKYLHPNDHTDPAFAAALREAAAAGVQILAMDCAVTADTMALRRPVEVKL